MTVNCKRNPFLEPREGDRFTTCEGEILVDFVKRETVYYLATRLGRRSGVLCRLPLSRFRKQLVAEGASVATPPNGPRT